MVDVTNEFPSTRHVSSCTEHRIVLNNCRNGIGIKIVGGKTSSGENHGIFVKRVVFGSVAEKSGLLKEGDKLSYVNNESMKDVTSERAIAILLNAARGGTVTLTVERSLKSIKEYENLVGIVKSSSLFDQNSNRSMVVSPTSLEKRSWILANGRMSPMLSEPLPKAVGTFYHKNALVTDEQSGLSAESMVDSGLQSSTSTMKSLSDVKVAHVLVRNGLGINVTGGTNHPDGPGVVVNELVYGGDAHQNGKIKPGDLLVSINGETFLNATHEQANMKLSQVKLKAEKEFVINYLPQRIDTGNSLLKSNKYDEIFSTNTSDSNLGSHFNSINQPPLQSSSVPTYLQQDLEISQGSPKVLLNSTRKPPKRRLSLPPSSKLQYDKLQVALSQLGVALSSEQSTMIRDRMNIDLHGCVLYGDFVEVVRDVLHTEVNSKNNVFHGECALNGEDYSKSPSRQEQSSNAIEIEMNQIRKERDRAFSEIKILKQLLREKQQIKSYEAEEMEIMKRTTEEALEESLAFKDEVHLAQQANKAAATREEEYEEIIKLLEDKIHHLTLRKTCDQKEFEEIQKKVVILGCQLKKSEVAQKVYEVVTQKLLTFADHVNEVLGHTDASVVLKPSLQTSRMSHKKISTPPCRSDHEILNKLREESVDVTKAVRMLLEEQPLPFGWEEAYTVEGDRYYVNHLDQLTSWLHPVTHSNTAADKD